NMENHFAIPVGKAIIGSDAVMIPDMTSMLTTSKDGKPLKSMIEVYNLKGKHLGYLHEIEVDEQFVVRYIYTDEYKIEMSKIVNYDDVIIADIEEAELEPIEEKEDCLQPGPETEEAEEDAGAAVSMEIGPDIKWEDANYKPEEKSTESSELSLVKPKYPDEEKKDIPDVDTKYAYLCGKQLLEGIEIEEKFYDKGTIIDAELIKHAIGNNAIVKVIVNAEE
ncbi:MAG: hypothetical protein VB106_06015, partial [Clostridiaceae bacterium]|nr:hypothetical protein [Clostridiaceae bacterium]